MSAGPGNDECPFCRIAGGGTDTKFLFSDADVMAFRDRNPHAPVHILIVPRRHIRSINDIKETDQALLGKMIGVAKDMAVREGIMTSGYKLLFNVEKGGGQVVFHLHLHLMGGWKK